MNAKGWTRTCCAWAALAACFGGCGGDADEGDVSADTDTTWDGAADDGSHLDGADADADADASADGSDWRCRSDADCDDRDPCSGVETCRDGTCTSGTPLPDGTTCDDGDRCTSLDACWGGECRGRNTCACTWDEQCAGYEDGDFCNGTLACVDNECVVDPATVVVCDRSADTDCLVGRCVPATGMCEPTPVADGTICDDGNGCTTGDACTAGRCTGASTTCTCRTAADCASHEDGDLCNGTLDCVGGACVVDEATVVVCDVSADPPCRHTRCEPATGRCAPVPRTDGSVCDDGDPCTYDTFCTAGACLGPRLECDDENPCTADSCMDDPFMGIGCIHDFGTGICDDHNVCTDDSCDEFGCHHAANRIACDDGDPCTGPDACDGLGSCRGVSSGLTDCAGRCVDLDADPGHCGACDHSCSAGETCVDGSCVPGSTPP